MFTIFSHDGERKKSEAMRRENMSFMTAIASSLPIINLCRSCGVLYISAKKTTSMRKATVELVPNTSLTDLQGNFFEQVEYMELLQMLRVDFDTGIRLAICKLRLKEGCYIEDLHPPMGWEILEVLKVDGNDNICLVKGTISDKIRPMLKGFDLELVWDRPTYLSSEMAVYSVIGDQSNLKKFFERIKLLGDVKSISCQRADYMFCNALSCLTDKQRGVLIEAKKSGYYDYPRRINADQLAERLGIGKSATIEHLRKAEGRIISQIFSGY